MKQWTERILEDRIRAETEFGRTPTHVVVRQEVWTELCSEQFGYNFELGGMIVSVTNNQQNPYEFLILIQDAEI